MLRGGFYFQLDLYPFGDGPNDRFYTSGYLSSLQDVVYIGVRVCMYVCVRASYFFKSPFILPPVLLQTLSTLRSVLMACRRWIQ
jgi:hypothetical protein